MVKRRLQQIGAFCLVCALFLSLLPAGLVPYALAEDVSAEEGRSKLYVHFVGDNGGAGVGTVPAPASENQHKENVGDAGWSGYKSSVAGDSSTVFWIGVGIDKLANFDLTKGLNGLFSAEVGMYYNPEYIRPYTGGIDPNVNSAAADAAFSSLVSQYNRTLWGADFSVKAALQNLPMQTEPLTEEFDPMDPTLLSPNASSEIVPANWRMTYLSIDKDSGDTSSNYLYGPQDEFTKYMVYLPFEVLKHDAGENYCLRLIRNATHFSIGASDGGYVTYGAWERETRNAGHNLKEMVMFHGDLNIWTGDYWTENSYTATLRLDNATGDNGAVLSIANRVPAVSVNQSNDRITDLAKNTEMYLDVTIDVGSVATATAEAGVNVPLTVVSSSKNQTRYSFIMPENSTTVTVKFTNSPSEEIRQVRLVTTQSPESPVQTGAKLIHGSREATQFNDIPIGDNVYIKLDYNSDYNVRVRAINAYQNEIVVITEKLHDSYYLVMPSENVTVYVDYVKAPEYNMRLNVPGTTLGYESDAYKAKAEVLLGASQPGNLVVTKTATKSTAEVGETSIPVRDERIVYVWVGMEEGEEAPYQAIVTLTHVGGSSQQEVLGLQPNEGAASFRDPLVQELAALALDEGFGYFASFVMPAYDVSVEVEFREKEERKVELNVLCDSEAAEAATSVVISGYSKTGFNQTDETSNTIKVVSGNQVTGTYDLGDEDLYEISSIDVFWVDDSQVPPEQVNVRYTLDEENQRFTFAMPTGLPEETPITVIVTIRDKTPEEFNLLAVLEPEQGTAGNLIGWVDSAISQTLHKSVAGERIQATVNVAGGYYIDSALLYSKENFYDFEITGNGYNNGQGGLVTISFTMPKLASTLEVLTLRVRLQRGLPPAVPAVASALLVKDESAAVGSNNNKAYIRQAAGAWQPTTGLTGVDSATMAGVGDIHRIYPPIGELISVRVEPQDGHYVKEVHFTPEHLVIPYSWISEDTFIYYQPEADVGVTVVFAKETAEEPAPDRLGSLTVNVTNPELGSYTVTDMLGAPIDDLTAIPIGTQVRLTATANSGSYIDHLSAAAGTPGATARTGNTGTDSITLYVQEHSLAYLTFQSGTAPDGYMPSTRAELTLTGPSGAGSMTWALYEDSKADRNGFVSLGQSAVISGGESNRRLVVTVSPTGQHVIKQVITGGAAVLHWTSSTSFYCDLPEEDISIQVILTTTDALLEAYTANLVLRPPSGYTTAEIGTGSMAGDGYSQIARSGESMSALVQAREGFYIDRVEVVPEILGAAVIITGDQAEQELRFTMPQGNVQINVYFGIGWPGESDHAVTLHVDGLPDSGTAQLRNQDVFRTASTGPVSAGDTGSVMAWDGDPMILSLAPEGSYQVDWTRLSIVDAGGNEIPYQTKSMSEIAFFAPNTVTDVYVYYRSAEEVTASNHSILFFSHLGGRVYGETVNSSNVAVDSRNSNNYLTSIPAGRTVQVTAVEIDGAVDTRYELVKVVVYGEGAEPLPIQVDMAALADVGGKSAWGGTFLMPSENISIQAFFRPVVEEGEDNRTQMASVVLLGAPAVGTSASATIKNVPANVTASSTVSAVSTTNNPSVMAKTDEEIQVAVTLSNRVISGVYALDDKGEKIPLTYAGVNLFSLQMPEGKNVTVYVETSAAKTGGDFTAQIVADRGGNEDNSAIFRSNSATVMTSRAGAVHTVEIVVKAGSELREITVTPARHHGVISQLVSESSNETQTVYTITFAMPADDVIIFVRFGEDTDLKRIVRLQVDHVIPEDAPPEDIDQYGNKDNKAWLYTVSPGTLLPEYTDKYVADPDFCDPIYTPDNNTYPNDGAYRYVESTASQKEVVLVKVAHVDGFYPSLVIDTIPSGGSTVHWVHGNENDMTIFAVQMPPSPINITVLYSRDQPNSTAYLHTSTGGTSTLSYQNPAQSTTVDGSSIIGKPGTKAQISLAAAQDYYIEKAYVMYGTIMVELLAESVTGEALPQTLTADFVLQQGDTHVYAVYAPIPAEPPTEREYTAALTVTGPKGPGMVPGRAGSATIRTGNSGLSGISDGFYTFDTYDSMGDLTGSHTADQNHALTAKPGDRVLITVAPNKGFELERITFTPIKNGEPSGGSYTPPVAIVLNGSGLNYYFVMPDENVGVEVRFAEGDTSGIYNATIHLAEIDAAGQVIETGLLNQATIQYGTQTASQNLEVIYVPYEDTVQVQVSTVADYYLESAYILYHEREIGSSKNVLLPMAKNLEEVNTAGPGSFETVFEMPKADADVFFVFHHQDHDTQPPDSKSEYTAALVMSDPGGTSSSQATLGRQGDSRDTVTVLADNNIRSIDNQAVKIEKSLTASAGETMYITTDLDISMGHTVQEIIITPLDSTGQQIPVTVDPNDPSVYTFTMPDYNISVYIVLETGNPPSGTATLQIVDLSAAIGNSASMAVGDQTVNTSGSQIVDISAGSRIKVLTNPRSGVKVTVLQYTTQETAPAETVADQVEYGAEMPVGNTVITVIFENRETLPSTGNFLARVVTKNRGSNVRNTASIEATNSLHLPAGEIWSLAEAGDTMQVHFTTADEYIVKVTAATEGGADLGVVAVGEQTSGSATFEMPAANVVVTVEYIRIDETYKPTVEMTVEVVGGTGGSATLTGTAGTVTATVGGAYQRTLTVNPNEEITLETLPVSGEYVKQVQLISGGETRQVTLLDGKVTLPATAAAARLVVTFDSGEPTGRPYDPDYTSREGYGAGYLTAADNRDSLMTISVPSLLPKSGVPESTGDVSYLLYYDTADGPVLLPSKAASPDDYAYEVIRAERGVQISGDLLGDRLTLRIAEGWSPLSIIAREGGTLYLSATATDQVESEKTQVYVPISSGSYTATLQIVDLSGLDGNTVQMSDGSRIKTQSGEILTGLTGTEQIRTVVKAATLAEIVSVMVTDSQGTRYLDSIYLSSAGDRYPFYMNNEDVVITVVFGRAADPVYTAAVALEGHHNWAENTASIFNTTNKDMPDGRIWTTGRNGDILDMTVKTRAGYYAVVTAEDISGNPVDVIQYGYTGSFRVLLTMPGQDVQITVRYTTEQPETSGGLTAQMTGDLDDAPDTSEEKKETSQNRAVISGAQDTITLIGADGFEETKLWQDDLSALPGETVEIDLSAAFKSATEYWFVSGIALQVGTRLPVLELAITDNTAGFTMPYAEDGEPVTLTITYAKAVTGDLRSFRPYDPFYSKTEAAAQGFVQGFIKAGMPKQGDDGRTTAVEIPTLYDIERANGTSQEDWDKLTDAQRILFYADAYEVPYTFYWRDAYGNFHELVPDTDMKIIYDREHDITCQPLSQYEAGKIKVERFTLRALVAGSELDRIMNEGGVIYVSSLQADKQMSDKVEIFIPENYTVTLHVSDTSTAAGGSNTATLKRNTDGETITAWDGKSAVLDGFANFDGLTVSHNVLGSASKVTTVVKTTKEGSAILLPSGGTNYTDTINKQDAAYTSVVVPQPDVPQILIAAVALDDPSGRNSNSATIANTSTSGLASGEIWAAGYLDDFMTVTVNAEPGYYALVTAETVNTGVPVPVLQWGATGTFQAQLYMPDGSAIPAEHVQVTVSYTDTAPDMKHLTLTMEMANQNATESEPENESSVTIIGDGAPILTVSGAVYGAPEQETSAAPVTAGYDLLLSSMAHDDYYVESVVMKATVNGKEFSFTYVPNLGEVAFVMPLAETEVVVTYEKGIRTGKPYDMENIGHAVYQDGYVDAKRESERVLVIDVPALSRDGQIMTDAYYDETNPVYTIYLRDPATGEFIPMMEGVDCAVTIAEAKDTLKNYSGAMVSVEILEGENSAALLEAIVNRDMIYITATRIATEDEELAGIAYVESEYQQVMIHKSGIYTALLHQVKMLDNSASPLAIMENLSDSEVPPVESNVSSPLDRTITNLEGDELMRGSLTKGNLSPGYLVKAAVLYYQYGGSWLLGRDGADAVNYIYPYTMPYEHVELTFIGDKDTETTRHVAAVAIVDENDPAAVLLNADDEHVVTIQNTADAAGTTSAGGIIWRAGYQGDTMRVDFDLPQDAGAYYAKVTAYDLTSYDYSGDLTQGVELPVMQFGTQTGYALFKMPDADVQVVVIITTTPPESGLLELELYQDGLAETHEQDVEELSGNVAEVVLKSSSATVVSANGTVVQPTLPEEEITGDYYSISVSPVNEGAILRLTAAGQETTPEYYVKAAYLTVGDLELELNLTDGEAEFIMPLNRAKVKVIYAEGSRASRPYDPNNGPDLINEYLAGHIVAEAEGLDVERNTYSAVVTVPTLYKKNDDPALTDATGVGFYFYYYDESTAAYVPLVLWEDVGKPNDIRVWQTSAKTETAPPYTDTTMTYESVEYNGSQLVLEVMPGSAIYDQFALGMVLYISADPIEEPDDPKTVESERTQLVIPRPSKGFRPYDERNLAENSGYLSERGWIYSENRGDHGLINVPMLKLQDGFGSAIVGEVRFVLHLQTGENTYVSLEHILDFQSPTYDQTSFPFDQPDYEQFDYESESGTEYQGMRFTYRFRTTEEIETYFRTNPKYSGLANVEELIAEATALADSLRDDFFETPTDASDAVDIERRLAITAVEIQEGYEQYSTEYVPVMLTDYFLLSGKIEGYDPTRDTTFSFYRYTSGDTADPENYEPTPITVLSYAEETGRELQTTDFALRSSLLKGTFQMVVERAGHVTYVWTGIVLDETVTDEAVAAMEPEPGGEDDPEPPVDDSPVPAARRYTIVETIRLWGGDVNGDGYVDASDRAAIDRLINFTVEYTKIQVPDKDTVFAEWAISIYNPYSDAFRANFDGDARINQRDKNVILAERNYGRCAADYQIPTEIYARLVETTDLELVTLAEEEILPGLPAEPEEGIDPTEPVNPGEEVSEPEHPEKPEESGEPDPAEPGESEDAEDGSQTNPSEPETAEPEAPGEVAPVPPEHTAEQEQSGEEAIEHDSIASPPS